MSEQNNPPRRRRIQAQWADITEIPRENEAIENETPEEITSQRQRIEEIQPPVTIYLPRGYGNQSQKRDISLPKL